MAAMKAMSTIKTTGRESRENILQELDELVAYIDEDKLLDNKPTPRFFENSAADIANEAGDTEQEIDIPTLTSVAEDEAEAPELSDPVQPGLFSERMQRIKQSNSKAEELQVTEAANEDNVPTLSDEIADIASATARIERTKREEILHQPVTNDIEQLVEILVQEQMPLLEEKLRARLRRELKKDK